MMEQSTFLGIAGLIAATSAAVSPFILLRMKRREKLEEWARQDIVADRLLAAQQRSIRGTDAVAALVKQHTESENSQLGLIYSQQKATHTIVNSEKTNRLQCELADKNAMLVLLKRVAAPSGDDKVHIAKVESRIAELEVILADRAIQQKIVDAQTAIDNAAIDRGDAASISRDAVDRQKPNAGTV